MHGELQPLVRGLDATHVVCQMLSAPSCLNHSCALQAAKMAKAANDSVATGQRMVGAGLVRAPHIPNTV